MRQKISLFLLVLLPFVVAANNVATRYFYNPQNNIASVVYGISYFDSHVDALQYSASTLPVRFNPSDNTLVCADISSNTSVSNTDVNTVIKMSSNHFYKRNINLLNLISSAVQYGYISTNQLLSCAPYNKSGTSYYFRFFEVESFCDNVFKNLTASQLLTIAASVPVIQSDVSALLPLVESNKNINAVIASDVNIAVTNANLQRSVILSDLEHILDTTVDYDIPQIRDDVRAFISSSPSVAMGDNTALVKEYFRLSGKNYDGLINIPITQFMVENGLASNVNDANYKLHSDYWRSSFLGPAITVQRQKQDLIAKLNDLGIQSPPGGFSNMNLGELETLYEYSYNTPTSTNATLQAKALDELKKINQSTTDALGTLSDIRNEVTGPQEVEVLNWPDDITGLSVSLSNAFAEAFANLDLNVSSEVWQLGRDYEEYRNHTAGVNPSYNSFFSDASFLAISGPNDGKWWTESQNLLAYIAFYTASNRSLAAGILSELATNNELFASSIAAASNNLSAIWGNNPRGWLDNKLDQLQEGQTELIRGFNSLTYFQGVENIIDTYYQDVQQLPTGISFDTPFPSQFYINLSSMRGFLELLHAATTLFLIGGWLICVPYIASWMFEHVNKMFDLFKK